MFLQAFGWAVKFFWKFKKFPPAPPSRYFMTGPLDKKVKLMFEGGLRNHDGSSPS